MTEKMTKAQWDTRRKSRLAGAEKSLPTTASIVLTVGEQTVTVPLDKRTFSSGSMGYFGQIRGTIGELPVNGTLNITVAGTAPYKG